MQPLSTFATLGLTLALAACGGGQTDDAPAAALPNEPWKDPFVENAFQPTPPATTTAQLVASPQFDFAGGRDLPFTLNVPEARGTTTNLNVCLDWEQDESTARYDVDYGSCILRTKMIDGYHDGTLALANRYDDVLAVVWFDEPDFMPVYRRVSLVGR